jgi:hypothetical protein
LPRRPERSDTSSSAEYASTDSTPHSPTSEFNWGRDCMVMGDRFMGWKLFYYNAFISACNYHCKDIKDKIFRKKELHIS